VRKPVIVGIGGGTAAGKTAIAQGLIHALGPNRVLRIGLDSYYSDLSNLDPIDRLDINYDHPDAIDSSTAVRDVITLAKGRRVSIPRYDFATHSRFGSEIVSPKPILVIEGILALVYEGLRQIYDIAVFIDAPADLRLARRLRRDLCERGASIDESIKRYFDYCSPMHLKYVEPSRAYADLTISGAGDLVTGIKQLLEVVVATANKRGIQRRSEQ